MDSLMRYVAEPGPCGYLPAEEATMEYDYVAALSPDEYLGRMLEGWRRFGHVMFRPVCAACSACRPLRVRVHEFRPDRSQRRCRQGNEGAVELRIGTPSLTQDKIDLYDRYHAHQARHKGWPEHGVSDRDGYARSFVMHPFAVEEWCYRVGDRLVGVGYVDCLPDSSVVEQRLGAGGLSAIYFFYDPEERERGLGTWNVLCAIAEARRRGLPYVYLGYAVAGCRAMEYKARFVPNEVRGADGGWRVLRA